MSVLVNNQLCHETVCFEPHLPPFNLLPALGRHSCRQPSGLPVVWQGKLSYQGLQLIGKCMLLSRQASSSKLSAAWSMFESTNDRHQQSWALACCKQSVSAVAGAPPSSHPIDAILKPQCCVGAEEAA